MARRTFSDASTELGLRLANRTDLTSTLIDQFLNDAMTKIALQYEHRCMQAGPVSETLPISTYHFTPATTDIWWVDFIRNDTDSRGIYLGDKEEIESSQRRSGIPFRFYMWAGDLYFDRTADVQKSLLVFYQKKLARWSGSSNLPFDENYDQLVLMWATKIGLETFRDFAEADLLGKQIGMYVAQMRFPLREEKKNDRNMGFKVRTR